MELEMVRKVIGEDLKKTVLEDLLSDKPRWLNPEIDKALEEIRKQLATTAAGFPARENLEAEAKILLPLDTPLRNRIPRVAGSGKAASWKVITSFGTLSTGFYAEGGTPSAPTTVYADRSQTYKCLGVDGEITGLAIAAGASFGDLLAAEKKHKLLQLMLEEEKQILQADSQANPNAFDGLIKQIDGDNGAYELAVNGEISTAAIDTCCENIFNQGGTPSALVLSPYCVKKITQALQGTGSLLRVEVLPDGKVSAGVYIGAYIDPISGVPIDIIVSRYLPEYDQTNHYTYALVLAEKMPDGRDNIEMDVLQEYGSQEVHTTTDTVRFRINVYEVLKVKGVCFCAKMTGVKAHA